MTELEITAALTVFAALVVIWMCAGADDYRRRRDRAEAPPPRERSKPR